MTAVKQCEERVVGDRELDGLLDGAFAELVGRYGREGRSQVKEGARYLVVLGEGGVAVGCGAVQAFGVESEHAGDGELKRMYVVPAARGRGYARALLAGLEELALAGGHPVLRLATGELQPEAIALYESSGYVRTASWGKYVDQPLTRCYAKMLVR
ncbi:acetyltransferase (GNAT) family protein [Kribbella voronezhensis]|uniref:Acetyltransferase (GNAT) family protein n=1 Tax=Kribbella voronezhensis TaxID=2512212 RepID=A0A4R7SWT3_9ACTN|nr:GNAT family N-acetyltransferase [Kribbella voronezhensis]TDU83691.1 acetyltransferase (GNAT) family protein [Kribbella voronezhensis]